MDPDNCSTMEASDMAAENPVEASNFGVESVDAPVTELEFPEESEAVADENVPNDVDDGHQMDEGEPEAPKEDADEELKDGLSQEDVEGAAFGEGETEAGEEKVEEEERNEEERETFHDEGQREEEEKEAKSEYGEQKEEAMDETNADDAKPDVENESSDVKNNVDDAAAADNDDQKSTRSDDDKDYFDTVDPEELEWYKEHPQDHNRSLNCTACFKQLSSEIGVPNGVFRHPVLGVVVCQQCRLYYKDGNWQQDEEGYDVFCRWCAEGGELVLCDKCHHSFCKRCLQRNLGLKFVDEITETDEWKCLVCDPKQIFELRALYHSVFSHQPELKLKWANKKVPTTTVPPRFGHNFLEENLNEAFTILDECRRALDDVRDMWDKSAKVVEPEIATTITRKLRKIYAINRQSMDQLDKAIVTCFVENFPLDSKRIHMGRVGSNANNDDDDEDIPVQRKRVQKKKPVPKKKATPANKKGKKVAQKSGKKGVIVVNGRPVTGEYVKPQAKKKLIVPKKRNYYDDDDDEDEDDSDIEVIGTSSAPPPLKKRKPAPASKSRY